MIDRTIRPGLSAKSATSQRADDTSPRGASGPAGVQSDPRRVLAAAALLLAITVLAHSPAITAHIDLFDDAEYITENTLLRSWHGLGQIWTNVLALPQYYPLTFTTYWAEYQLWGARPLGYHLVNLGLHFVAALLLWRLLVRLAVPGAWLAAAVFAVHPVCVETVAWVAEQKNTLSLALALGSMICYLRFAPLGDGESPRDSITGGARYYALAFLLYVAAMLAKTAVITLPAVLLVIDWWKRGRIAWADVRRLIPFFAVGAGLGWLTQHVEKVNYGTTGAEFSLSFVERSLIAGRALCFYAGKVLWPQPLIHFYPKWEIHSDAWPQYLYPAAAIGLIAALWLLRNRIGRGPLSAVLIFAGVLTPALGFFNVWFMKHSFVADHFQYHACPALIALCAGVAVCAVRRWPAVARAGAGAAAAGVLLLLSGLTFSHARAYHEMATLQQDVVEKNPDSVMALMILAVNRFESGDHREALALSERALQLAPDDPQANVNLGHFLIRIGEESGFAPGDLERAMSLVEKGLTSHPRNFEAHTILGFALLHANRPDEARRHFQAALQIKPDWPRAHYGLGSALFSESQWSAAQECFAAAVALDSKYADAQYALALSLIQQGQIDAAVAPLQATLEVDPGYHEAQSTLQQVMEMQRQRRKP